MNCVIVKDLSRLGRNTIDTGYYIEQYFRLRNVRFIAVNENFDTAAPEDAHSGIIIPLRNMINEAYATGYWPENQGPAAAGHEGWKVHREPHPLWVSESPG